MLCRTTLRPSLPAIFRSGRDANGENDPPRPLGVPPSEEGRSGQLGPPPPVFRDLSESGPTEPPPPYEIESARSAGAPRGIWTRLLIGLVILLVLFIVANIVISLYVDRLWFDELGYRNVFDTRIGTRIWLFFAGFGIAGTFFLLNLAAAWRLPLQTSVAPTSPFRDISLHNVRRTARIATGAGVLFLAIIFGAIAWQQWELILTFIDAEPFGIADPHFNKDTGFYVFKLETLQFIKGWALGVAIVSLIAGTAVYGFRFMIHGGNAVATRSVRIHAALLLAVIIGLVIWGYWLARFELVLSENGTVFGATFTDANVRDTAYLVLMAVGGAVGIAVLTWPFHQRLAIPGATLGVLVAASLGGLAIYPAIVQRFTVEPNELNQEREFIERNIEMTRLAFGLDGIQETSFPANERVSEEDVRKDQASLQNIRVWDHRPLIDTINTSQRIRPQYRFPDVDVDRYEIDGRSRQVFLGARELSQSQLSSDQAGWVNRRLQFTHGFGLAVNPVDIVTESGRPSFFVSNIPPEISNVDDPSPFEITQPRIYFGEDTGEWVIVNSDSEEFDYPLTAGTDKDGLDIASQARNRYDGSGGIPLGGFFKRLAMAWSFSDTNMLISGSVDSESRLLFRRNIQDRVAELAPFLKLDADPYIVIGETGRLSWIQDAYTSTDRFPYAQPHASGVNYIRNSVKAVINAFDGTVDLYIIDETDPIIRVWDKIFPNLLKPKSEFPADLREHWRYPQDLFQIQADQYLTYHVTSPTSLFNRQDTWAIPLEVLVQDQTVPLEPYYVTLSLPDSEEPEFLLITPFTPRATQNAIAWMAGRSDGDHYGELFAFTFPSNKNVNGPQQIEATIGQQSDIREQITLLGQGGSQVIRGNLLFIPVGDSYLYVEPFYVQADASAFPQLQFVVVVNDDDVAFSQSLEEAATAALGFRAGTGAGLATDDGTIPDEANGDETAVEPGADAPPPANAGDTDPDGEQSQPQDTETRDLQSLLDDIDRAIDDARGQTDTLEHLRDALGILLSDQDP
jgi:uncharacterized membrane protein (UPF0182 family)